jgi:hypothetical protein
MRATELSTRLACADAYLMNGQADGRWDIVSDAIRMRCRILAEAGVPEYASWKNDTRQLPRRP